MLACGLIYQTVSEAPIRPYRLFFLVCYLSWMIGTGCSSESSQETHPAAGVQRKATHPKAAFVFVHL